MAGKKRAMGRREWTAFFSWIILSILILTLDKGFRSSEFSEGFGGSLEPAIKVIPIFGGAAAVVWLLLISRLLKRLRNNFLQWFLILLPVIALTFWTFRKLPNPNNQFREITKVQLPSEVTDFKSRHKAVLFSEFHHSYSFRCSPTDTTRLIEELGWGKPSSWDPNRSWINKKSSHPVHNLDIDSWFEPEVYSVPSKGGLNRLLVTDQKKERVFINLSHY